MFYYFMDQTGVQEFPANVRPTGGNFHEMIYVYIYLCSEIDSYEYYCTSVCSVVYIYIYIYIVLHR